MPHEPANQRRSQHSAEYIPETGVRKSGTLPHVKRLLIFVLLLVLTLGVALATRPDRASFERRIARLAEPGGGSLLDRASSALRKIEAGFTLEYHDHNLWAVGEVRQGGKRLRYLGAFGVWIPLGSVSDR